MKALALLAAGAFFVGGCMDPKAPEYPCVVDARAEYQIYGDYYRANAVYRQCLHERGLDHAR